MSGGSYRVLEDNRHLVSRDSYRVLEDSYRHLVSGDSHLVSEDSYRVWVDAGKVLGQLGLGE